MQNVILKIILLFEDIMKPASNIWHESLYCTSIKYLRPLIIGQVNPYIELYFSFYN